jgi:prophage DNA circulation protein
MPSPVIADFQGCSFKGTDLSRNLLEWKDTRQPALAVHRFIRKNGGLVEVLGRKPHQARVTLAYAGPSWRAAWLPFAASLDDDPSGPLVHPVYGQMPAVCEGFVEATMNVETAPNLYIVPLTFIENQLGAAIAAADSAGPHALQQRAQAHGAALLQRAPAQGPVRDNALRYVTSAVGYANAAIGYTSDALSHGRQLQGQLDAVERTAVAARDAVRADSAAGSDAERYDLIALIEQLYDDCLQLDAAVRTTRAPAMIRYVVPSTVHVAVLATRFYGSDGVSRVDEILGNNPGLILNPAAIAAGTRLRMAPPTVPVV